MPRGAVPMQHPAGLSPPLSTLQCLWDSPVPSQDLAQTKVQGWENPPGGSSIRGTLVFMLK